VEIPVIEELSVANARNTAHSNIHGASAPTLLRCSFRTREVPNRITIVPLRHVPPAVIVVTDAPGSLLFALHIVTSGIFATSAVETDVQWKAILRILEPIDSHSVFEEVVVVCHLKPLTAASIGLQDGWPDRHWQIQATPCFVNGWHIERCRGFSVNELLLGIRMALGICCYLIDSIYTYINQALSAVTPAEAREEL
jgi:hypothetical protein